jgi:hypothetical protein
MRRHGPYLATAFVALALVVGQSVVATSRSSKGKLPVCWEIDNTYYSDYFTTIVGWNSMDCNCSTEQWGPQDGAYWHHNSVSCPTGVERTYCYQKVNGTWVQITCP